MKKACLCLHSITDYSTLSGSYVFIAALDSFKAFDKINHYGLLIKMINARVSLFVWPIRVIANFHNELSGLVFW